MTFTNIHSRHVGLLRNNLRSILVYYLLFCGLVQIDICTHTHSTGFRQICLCIIFIINDTFILLDHPTSTNEKLKIAIYTYFLLSLFIWQYTFSGESKISSPIYCAAPITGSLNCTLLQHVYQPAVCDAL